LATRKSEPFLNSGFSEGQPAVSPDGGLLAFTSNATGSYEVYVQNLARGSARIRISTNGGRAPRWRSDSRELFFFAPDASAMISAVPDAADRWDAATLTELFRRPRPIQAFAVAPDGRSFLISERTPGTADALFHVVLGSKP
jgi:Tol biopolymer transport system component